MDIDPKRRIAAFDFDGTLTSCDTFLEFIRFTKGNIAFYLGILCCSPWLIAYKLRLYPNGKAKEKLFAHLFRNVSLKQFDDWSEAFTNQIDTFLRPDVLLRQRELSEQGYIFVVVSASIENWLAPWSHKHGVDTLLATQIEVDEQGKLTGRFRSPNCYGAEKVVRLREKFPERETYRLVAFGDSRGDRELLAFADEGIRV